MSLRWETFTAVSLSLSVTRQWGFMGRQDGLKMWCAWPDSGCLSEAAGSVGGVKSSHQACRKSETAKKKDVKQTQFKFLRFFFPSSGRLISPPHSSFPLFPGHTLGAPPGSGWECCRPCPRRARRGCTAAGCSGPNCVEWEKRRPARTNQTQKCGKSQQTSKNDEKNEKEKN